MKVKTQALSDLTPKYKNYYTKSKVLDSNLKTLNFLISILFSLTSHLVQPSLNDELQSFVNIAQFKVNQQYY